MTTLPQLLVDRARSTPNAVALREKHLGIWEEVSWAKYLERVRLFALGLRTLGVSRGDKVAIIGDNRPEWFIAELSAQSLGAAAVGLFQDATPAEVQYVVDHSDARVVVVEDQEQVDKLLAISETLPKLEYIVYCAARGLRDYRLGGRLVGFESIEALGAHYEAREFEGASWVKRQVYAWGMRIGYACADRRQVPFASRLQHAVAERLVFAPVRDHLGLSKLRRAYTGGAALGPDTLRFFRALGVNLKQAYVQTEVGGLSVVHRDAQVDPESVGRPIPNTEVRIAANGEILTRSDALFNGYYKDAVATAAAVQAGWLHSGDAGFLNARGELVVLDRLQDLVTLDSGQTFAPQYVENKLKFSPYVKEAVAFGQDRPYLVALVNIYAPNVGTWADLELYSIGASDGLPLAA
jgi:long-subunit acyl-CoA synthetase (AMP-forming)